MSKVISASYITQRKSLHKLNFIEWSAEKFCISIRALPRKIQVQIKHCWLKKYISGTAIAYLTNNNCNYMPASWREAKQKKGKENFVQTKKPQQIT